MKAYKLITSAGLLFLLTLPVLSMPPLDGGPEPQWHPTINSPGSGFIDRDDPDLEGEWKVLIILVDFEDYPWDFQDDENFPNEEEIYTPEHFENMLFSEGEYQHPGSENDYTGSMRDYYLEVSDGVFEVVGTVTRWYRAPEPLRYYCNFDTTANTDDDFGLGFASYPHNVQKLVEDVLELADDEVDFSEFDNDENGEMDGLFIVHAGPGAERMGQDPDYIWSHKWQIREPQERDGVGVFTYTMEPEDGAIGVFCHEYGHFIGLPDLYDTDYSSAGIGDWGLMAGGSWGTRRGDPAGSSPVHLCAWSKMKLDWLDLTNITRTTENVEIPPTVGNNVAYRLWTGGDEDSREYFLVENRRQEGFDAALTTRQVNNDLTAPEGLLILHIDENQFRNDDEERRLVDVVEASPIFINNVPRENLDGGLENRGRNNLYNAHRGDDGDLWPGYSGHNEDSTEWAGDRDLDNFGSFTIPSSRRYDEQPSLVEVYDIRMDDENVICSFSVDADDVAFPGISDYETDDSDGGNGDGYLEPGETIELTVEISNVGGQPAENVVATLRYEGDLLEITVDEAEYGRINPGESMQPGEPFQFEISEDAPRSASLVFSLAVTGDNLEEDFIYPIYLTLLPAHEWFKHPDNPVLTGEAETWTADGLLSPALLVEIDTLKCWFIGSGLELDDPIQGSVGYAYSINGGFNWVQREEPVLSPDPESDWMNGLGGIGIMSLGEQGYVMALLASDFDSVSTIGLAYSEDGFEWEVVEGPVLTAEDGWPTEFFGVGQISIFPFGPAYAISFAGINAAGLSGIAVAFSQNMLDWSIDPNIRFEPNMDRNNFDAFYMISPEVIVTGQEANIIYAGLGMDNRFRLGMISTDGQNVTRHNGTETGGSILEPGGVGSWGEAHLMGGRIFEWEDETRLLFNGGTMFDNDFAFGIALQSPTLSAPEVVDNQATIPATILLDPAYPNPFNSSTRISYHLTQPGMIRIGVFDLTGREVARLREGYQRAGSYTLPWNGMTGSGISVSSGIYFIRLKRMDEVRNLRLLFVK